MTYRELAIEIGKLTEEQKDKDITVYDTADEEYYPMDVFNINDNDIVENTPIIVF